MASGIDSFVDAVRNVFAHSEDARAQARGIAGELKVLLARPDLMQEIAAKADGRPGRIDLHIDDEFGHPGPGFCLMTSISRPGGRTVGVRAHDHGASYVVYGVHKGAIEQTKYTWAYEGDPTAPVLKPGDCFVQNAGEVAFFLPGEIHRTTALGEDAPVVLRLEGQLLDRVSRHTYDLENNDEARLYG